MFRFTSDSTTMKQKRCLWLTTMLWVAAVPLVSAFIPSFYHHAQPPTLTTATGHHGGPVMSKSVSCLFQSSTCVSIADAPSVVVESTVSAPDQAQLSMSTLTKDEEVKVPALGTIAKMLPRRVFQIDTKKSLLYFGIDMVAVLSTLTLLHAVVTSELYHSLPLVGQAFVVAPLQLLAGFAMWCMWCIGHDAGHGTVSRNHDWVNQVVGEVAHSMVCLTPFQPWAKSHLKHHLNHNHLTRDYSHQWFIREEQDTLHPLIQASYQTRNAQLPILYLVYLLFGIPDGSHVFFYGRMWEGESMRSRLRGALSVSVSFATALSLWMTLGTADFAVVCFVPWLVCSFWLFMVTYLQHHSEDGKLYTDDTWTFNKGAFETVDRDYGKWINRMSHHMMDGHVAHHLFFTKIPHYHLEEATRELVKALEDNGQSHLYKQVDTPAFTQEIVRQFNDNWFFINEEQVVRS
jgi:acyl-lipid omega-3 desaturase